ncbi:MAG: hypothetical protein WBC44_12680 [Planctomycetaceae bacterium]
MILLDADVLLIDIRYPDDVRFPVNRELLDRLRSEGRLVGITTQALLEIVGVLSFNVTSSKIDSLPDLLCVQYGLAPIPDPEHRPDFAGCSFREVVSQISRKMSLGDAVQAVQIERFASAEVCLLSWNAKHFVGKLAGHVQTPAEWLAQHNPSG